MVHPINISSQRMYNTEEGRILLLISKEILIGNQKLHNWMAVTHKIILSDPKLASPNVFENYRFVYKSNVPPS